MNGESQFHAVTDHQLSDGRHQDDEEEELIDARKILPPSL